MNKAITDGAYLMPPSFEQALDFFSAGDGTPGSTSYAGQGKIAQDADFGSCLELTKTENTQNLRYMGETPLLPGCYLQISVRVKALSGPLPSVRIAGFAGGAGGAQIKGVVATGPSVSLPDLDQVIEISAIVGPGARLGVDMVWGPDALYGHFGVDFTGANGAVLRVESIVVKDISSAFLRDVLPYVDVRDYGAVGNGEGDDTDAFDRAIRAARGRQIVVPGGVYKVTRDIVFETPVHFQGTLNMPEDAALVLTRNFDVSSYAAAFGSDEEGFRKGLQALMRPDGPDTFDLGGRCITLKEPMKVATAVSSTTGNNAARTLRNGAFCAQMGDGWHDDIHRVQAVFDPTAPSELQIVGTGVDIPAGACLEDAGKEAYVVDQCPASKKIYLSEPAALEAGVHSVTFREPKYMLDFQDIKHLHTLTLSHIRLDCDAQTSGIRAPSGTADFRVLDCTVSAPNGCGIMSVGSEATEVTLDRTRFFAMGSTGIAVSVSAEGVRLQNCQSDGFTPFGVISAATVVMTGNHITCSPDETVEQRAGLIVTNPNAVGIVQGNLLENCALCLPSGGPSDQEQRLVVMGNASISPIIQNS